MIEPKRPRPSKAEEADAYEAVTLRDKTCVALSPECVGVPQRDHRQNRQAGNTVVANLQLLCVHHHGWKTEHPADAIYQGYAVSRYEDFREWPARRFGVWVLYRDDGTWTVITDLEAWRRMGLEVPF